jgi:carbon-monoxide dehydrogenase medium subunit
VDSDGAQWHDVESLFGGPGLSAVDPTRQLVTHVRFPFPDSASSGGWGTAWQRVGRRPSLVLPILNCAVKLRLENGRIAHATIALGPVAPRPFRAREAEAFLRGQPPTADRFEEAARLVQRASNPRSSVKRASREYRLAIIPTLVTEALSTAAERANT